jgi:cellulose synthase/poly-beta-1,6-N-acetylglucosamine synthase-like glycosyltransferase
MITALIAAHNEAEIIATTIKNLCAATPPPDQIIVIADGCTDTTVEVSEASGAIVFQCDQASKGGALKWLLAQDRVGLKDRLDLIVIFDADSTVSENFFAETQRAFSEGAHVTQSFVQPINLPSTASVLAAYSEILSQIIDDAIRSRFSWGVPLRGTGMAFRVELLYELLPHLHTLTEDIELTLLLMQRSLKVNFLPHAIVYDPKPVNMAQVSRQRARWLQGQAHIWRSYKRTILSLLWRSFDNAWLLNALLLKPKTFFVWLKFVLGPVLLLLPISAPVKLIALFFLVLEIIYYVGGLLLLPTSDRQRYAHALLFAPLYLFVWLKSVLLAWREQTVWLSGRHK